MRLFAIVGVAVFAAQLGATCTAASGYSYAEAVVLAAPGATLTSFPQPFYTGGSNLSTLATALAANAQADGDDIIFRTEDPASTISHTMMYFNSSTGEYFAFLGPLTRSGELTICVNYGNAGATSTSSATPVGSLEAVIGCDSTTDWTGNSHTAVESGTPGTVTGPVCPAHDFDETVPSYLTLTASGSGGEIDSGTTFRMSLLARGDDATSALDSERVVWRNVTTTSQRWPIMIWGESSGTSNGTAGKQGSPISTYGPLAGNSWHWITVVYDDATANNSRAWVDGTLVDTDSPSFALSTPTGDMLVGGHPTSSVSWSGSIGLFMVGLTAAAGDDDWQAYEAASILDPNTVFSLGSSPALIAPVIFQVARRIAEEVTVPQDAAASTCASTAVQVGDACDPFGAGLDLLLGATDR